MKNIFFLLGLVVALFISACGGGSSTSPASQTFSGVAAVGFPIVGGTVSVICATGSPLTGTTTSTGTWQVTLSDQTLPCAVRVSGGTINSATNTTPYHSIALALGTVNVTPLTDMMVANLAGAAPDTWFTGLSTTPASLNAISQTHVDGSLANLRAALSGLAPLSTINPITTAFSATPGNTSDDMLAALQTSLANSGTSYGTLLTAASTPASFTTAATTLNSTISAASGLAGTWNRHRLQAGRTFTDIATGAITSVTSNWNHGYETVDVSGTATTGAELSSTGSTVVGTPFAKAITSDGVVTESDFPSFHGTMSPGKDLVVGTATAGNGLDPRLVIFQKQNPAITFTMADLLGTWDRHFLRAGRTFTNITTGAITSTTNKWEHGVETWDASGNFTEVSGAWSEAGAYVPGSGTTQSISADGIVTDSAVPTFHGIMSASKDLVVTTKTAGNGKDVTLSVFQKRNPAVTFTMADLAGTWSRHAIRAGRTFTNITTGAIISTTNKWEHGVETWDASGNFTEVSGAWSEAGAYVLSSGSGQLISASGIITDPAAPTFHGIMSASKDLVVATKTAGNGIDVVLVIFQRMQ
ncbi:MAG: hypothetical protein Q8O64_07600 [Sideroxyarcus sp.]|nr:hypothetical protein [Sideroxyarcus sp.]